MIIHRTIRDVQKCRRKYGQAWTEYEKMVPYLFIPVSSLGLSDWIFDEVYPDVLLVRLLITYDLEDPSARVGSRTGSSLQCLQRRGYLGVGGTHHLMIQMRHLLSFP